MMDKEVLLANYFSNRLSDEERKRFDELLDSDAEFRKQFDFEQNLQSAIKNTEKEKLKAKLISFEKEIEVETLEARPKRNYRYLAIAASILLLIGITWMGYQDGSANKYDNLYAANFQEYPNTVYTITRGDGSQSIEREAFVAYESKNFELAVEKFKQITVEKQEPYVDFYLAHSYLGQGQNKEAKQYFKKTIAKNDAFVGESHWFLALISLKEKDESTAIGELKKLTTEHDYNKDKALELLEELK